MDERLVDEIAEALHDGWWETMVEDGYSLGPRDDVRKTHPHLRPWAELPEANNNQDRYQARKIIDYLRQNAHPRRENIARLVHDSWVEYMLAKGRSDHPHTKQVWDVDERGKREHLRQADKVLTVWNTRDQ